MQFALIIDSPRYAKAPAARVPAVPSVTGIGLWDSDAREIWQAETAAIRAALPAALRRAYDRTAGGVWHVKGTRYESGRMRGEPPRVYLERASGGRLATVYLIPVDETAATPGQAR